MHNNQRDPTTSIGLYIHFPFCLSKCLYCSFNSVPYNPDLARRYTEAIKKEIVIKAAEYRLKGRSLKTIYFGGGTPSILSPSVIEDIIAVSGRIFCLEDGIEITIEANPDTLDKRTLEKLRHAWINRISIGVQSLSDKYLKLLGRSHDADRVRRIFKVCRSTGFKNISLDLIYALPDQRINEWLLTVREAISLSPEHISIYCLTIDKGTVLYDRLKKGQISPLSEEDQIEMYLAAAGMLEKAGYFHYEISNFCLPGRSSRHNMLYWDRGEYLAIGAGAHSYIGNSRFCNTDSIERYMAGIDSGHTDNKEELLTVEDQFIDAVIFGLRKTEGIDLDDIRRRFDLDPLLTFRAEIEALITEDMITLSSSKLRLTRKGILLADHISQKFLLPEVSQKI
ncbi:MAG: radical SAM family heme chaperone HemW [Nitrospirota bacterium]